jgi:hypothetical protein
MIDLQVNLLSMVLHQCKEDGWKISRHFLTCLFPVYGSYRTTTKVQRVLVHFLSSSVALHKILGGGGGGFSTCMPKGFRSPFKALSYVRFSENGST